ncbi:hypothetical protein Nos7524_3188 [Nostoc sp. PCC 7524]|uniref:hypothetical protein n=1 Tax=Nostoc sp. (strain ATCC 29411 / PCC 7524) TaxID=28072 RepID=UPI00029EDE2E|nr:hypothetical protein Nos7524_3188 [Nostoc sp. PCC 7524]
MSKDRITSTYKPGQGDLGWSQVLHNSPPLLKNSPAAIIQGAIELLRHKIELFLSLHTTLQYDLDYLLNYLDRNIFTLASFCYLKADTDKHLLPCEALDWLSNRVAELEKELGSCPDFLYHKHPKLVCLDGVRIQVRELERIYISWRYSTEIITHLLVNPQLTYKVNYHSAILNRLSSYLFWTIRKEGTLLRSKGLDIEERYWLSQVEDFNPPKESLLT